MADFRNSGAKLTIALAVCAFVLAALLLSTPAEAGNRIATLGDIKIYDESGECELTSITLPLLAPASPDARQEWFIIRNMAKQPMHVNWGITASSITWSRMAENQQSGYCHTEGGIRKYTFRVLQHVRGQDACLAPKQQTILLGGGESAKLCFELAYSGKPNTAEVFTMTMTFFGTTEPTHP